MADTAHHTFQIFGCLSTLLEKSEKKSIVLQIVFNCLPDEPYFILQLPFTLIIPSCLAFFVHLYITMVESSYTSCLRIFPDWGSADSGSFLGRWHLLPQKESSNFLAWHPALTESEPQGDACKRNGLGGVSKLTFGRSQK